MTTNTSSEKTLKDMLKNAVHFGHRPSKWNPKMKSFIHGKHSGVHVFDLNQTASKLKEAQTFLKSCSKEGKVVLFVSTKQQAIEVVRDTAEECGMPYITHKWVPGLLTNFGTIKQRIKHLKDLKAQELSGEFEKYTKKERVMFDKEIEKLESYLSGVEKMEKRPEAIFVMDIRNEKTAREEAKKVGMPIIAVCDTNTNPDKIDYVVPANDDAIGSITLVANVIAEAVEEGCKAMPAPAPKVEQKTDKPKRAALKIGGSD